MRTLLSVRCLLLLSVVAIAGCSAGAAKQGSAGRENADGADPLNAYFADPPIIQVSLSPSGDRAAYLTTKGGAQMIVVLDVASFDRKPILRLPHAKLQLEWLEWANDERIVFAAGMPFGRSTGVRARSRLLFAIDSDGQNLRHLGARWFGREGNVTEPDAKWINQLPIQFEDDVVAWLPKDPQHILISLRAPRQAGNTGVYLLDVDTGDIDEVVGPKGRVWTWFADPSGWVGMGTGPGAGSTFLVFGRAGRDGPFEELASYDLADGAPFQPLGLSERHGIAYVASTNETGRAAIYEFDLEAKRMTRQLFSHPSVDAGQLIYSSPREKYVGVRYTVDRPKTHYWDAAAREEQARIDRALPGRDNRIFDQSRDGTKALLRSSSDTHPPSIHFYDREAQALEELYSTYPKLDDQELAPMRPVTYTARDGLKIPAYLTLPLGREAKNLPVVVLPHGGPWARDSIAFDPQVQFLASRGYAVFQMNFRGSTGYGRKFTELGHEELGEKMQDDLTDGVQWLIADGIADPNRIAIYGASYGGYAALMGAATTPELFQCAASYAGVTDLDGFMDDLDWYNADARNAHAFGRDPARRRRNSPVNLAEQIQIPILLGHGRADSVVHYSQAKAMADALDRAGKPAELMLLDDEIHGTRSAANRIQWWTRLAAFFDACLAPKQTAKAARADS